MKILNLDNWREEATTILKEVAEVTTTRTAGEHYDGIIASLSKSFTSEHLIMFPNLKFVASCTTGLDHLPLDALQNHGIEIISLQGETDFLKDVHATSEMAWALIMALIRKVPFAHSHVIDGNWDRESFQGIELHSKTLGVIGLGRTGKQVMKFAKAFGMNVIFSEQYNSREHFEDVLRKSDIVTVHVSLNKTSEKMFGEKEFSLMKPTAYFVNTSRGRVVDESALQNALLNKTIAGAAIDVITDEPNIEGSWLWKHLTRHENMHNLIVTPHISGNTVESRKKTQLYIAQKIKEYILKAQNMV